MHTGDYMNWILCGLPMCGKTTVGKIIAEQTDKCFIDTDELMEKSYFQENGELLSCREIFKQKGEVFFRALESFQIASLANVENSVIAIGGGTLCYPNNTNRLRSIGSLIYIKTDLPLLWQRVSYCGIPAYLDLNHPEQAFYASMKERIPTIEAAADFIIENSCATLLNPQEMAKQILKKMEADNGK